MKKKISLFRASLKLLALLILVYLIAAFVWAWAVTPEIVSREMTRKPFDLSRLPADFVPILTRVEDPSFFVNPGIDPFSSGQGLTTMTQALTRILLLSDENRPKGWAGGMQILFLTVQSFAHKIDIGRDVMAIAFNLRCNKETQLQLFLTHVYMGSARDTQVYGIARASEIYYRTNIEKLNRHQIVGLVAMMLAPNQYNPLALPDIHKQRVERIERLIGNRCSPAGVLDIRLEGCAR